MWGFERCTVPTLLPNPLLAADPPRGLIVRLVPSNLQTDPPKPDRPKPSMSTLVRAAGGFRRDVTDRAKRCPARLKTISHQPLAISHYDRHRKNPSPLQILYIGCPAPGRLEAERALAAAALKVVWAGTHWRADHAQRTDMPVLLDLSRGAAALRTRATCAAPIPPEEASATPAPDQRRRGVGLRRRLFPAARSRAPGQRART